MIDTEALRKKAIDLAIQGKLTQQLPEDGDAEDLYVQIQKEKAKHIKEGKIKKEKPLPEISDDEIPFEIPKNWKWVRFLDVVMSISSRGHQITTSELNEIGNYAAISQGLEFIDGYSNEEDKVIWDAPLVLFGDHTRNVKFIDYPFVVCSDGTHLFKFITCDNKYLYYWTKSVANQMQSRGYARHFSLLKKCLIPLPPLDEQMRIVKLIETVFAQIDIIDSLQQQYESDREILKGKIIDAGIRGKLTEQLPEDGNAEDLYAQIQEEKAKLIKEGKIKKGKPLPEISDDEIPFEIPQNWKWVRFGDIAIFYNGDRSKNYPNRSEYQSKGVAWINTGHITATGFLDEKTMNYITEEKYESLAGGKIQEGDLVYCLRGATFGKVARVEPFDRGAIASSLMIIRMIDKSTREYIYWFLRSGKAMEELHKYDNGAAQPNLAAKSVEKYLIPLPPEKEMTRITLKIEQSLASISTTIQEQ